jgi:hypothetical protein
MNLMIDVQYTFVVVHFCAPKTRTIYVWLRDVVFGRLFCRMWSHARE